MRSLWKRIQGTAVGLWGVLRRVSPERWCRIAVGSVLLVEICILLSASGAVPMEAGNGFGEIHWYKGEG